MGRQAIGAIAGYFFLVIGAHFYYGHFCIFFYPQDSQGNADMIIQVALGGIGNVARR